MPTLVQIKNNLRAEVTEHLGDGIKATINILADDSRKYTLLLQLSGRYKETKNQEMAGVSSSENIKLSYNKIRSALLDTIDELKEKDIKSSLLSESNHTPENNTNPNMGSSSNDRRRSMLQRKLDKLEERLLRIEGTDAGAEFRLEEEIEDVKKRLAELS